MDGCHQTNFLRTTVGPVASGISSSRNDKNQNNAWYPILKAINVQLKIEKTPSVNFHGTRSDGANDRFALAIPDTVLLGSVLFTQFPYAAP